jgi:hypothetical protein
MKDVTLKLVLKMCEEVKLNFHRIFSVWWALTNALSNSLGSVKDFEFIGQLSIFRPQKHLCL